MNSEEYKKTLYIGEKNLLKNKEIKFLKFIKIPFFPNIFNRILNYLYFELYFRFSKKKYHRVYGQDHLIGSHFFVTKYQFYIIEDGLSFYTTYIKELNDKFINENKIKKIFRKVLKINFHHGLDKRIKTIYMSNLANIPREFLQKEIKYFNLKLLWNRLSSHKKEEILHIYNLESIKKMLSEKGKINLLVTQPLSEDGYITEKEKIEIYSKIINENSEIVIKPHPREKTQYKDYFEKVIVLDQNTPAELYSLADINFEKVISLFSTSLFNSFEKSNREILGTMNNKKLEKYFGKIDYMLKKGN